MSDLKPASLPSSSSLLNTKAPWVHTSVHAKRARIATNIDGILPIDKPCGCSSYDVIRRLKYTIGFRKIGHAGTLDPLAMGLLLIVLGKATKASQALMCGTKIYEGVIQLGVETTTYDREGEVTQTRPTEGITEERIRTVLQSFIGDQYKQPPVFSAKKINGIPLYKLARKGQEPKTTPNFITIFQCDLLSYDAPNLHLRVCCSKGTYIRSLAHDIGSKLNCGGHLAQLRRTHSGNFSVDQAVPLDALLEEPALLKKYLVTAKTTNGQSYLPVHR